MRTSSSCKPFFIVWGPAQIPPGGRPCWRPSAGKALSHRRATPTVRPESRPAAAHVGATPPAKPYPTAGPRQQSGPNPARQPPMLALPRRQSLIPSSGHANSPDQIPPGSRPCWRPSAGKTLSHRRATPTVRTKSHLPAVHVGAAPPAKPYPTAWPRQQSGPNPARQPSMLAPPRRQSLIPPSGHANSPARILPVGRPCWRCPASKTLSHRRATPTVRPESRPAAAHVGATPPAKPYPTAGPRQQSGPNPARQPPMLALPRRQSLIPSSGHANSPARIPPGSRPCWRPSAGKTLSHRRATPTVRTKSHLPAVHVGAAPPAKPYPTAWPRQQSGPNPARQPSMLAPPRRQSLIPPSGHANSPARILPVGRPCWRCPAGKALSHRRATPTGRPESRPVAVHVGAAPPAKPYPTAWPRQQAGSNPARRPPMLALPRRQSLIPPPGHANRPARIPPGSRPCWRPSAGKTLSHRRATPTGRPESCPSAVHVAIAPCEWAAALIYST